MELDTLKDNGQTGGTGGDSEAGTDEEETDTNRSNNNGKDDSDSKIAQKSGSEEDGAPGSNAVAAYSPFDLIADGMLKLATLSSETAPGTEGDEINTAPVVKIISPTTASTVNGTVVVRVDASDLEDALGTLAVQVSTDGGASWHRAAWTIGTFYDYRWDTPTGYDGAEYTLVARAMDRSAKASMSAAVSVTVDSISTGPFASVSGELLR